MSENFVQNKFLRSAMLGSYRIFARSQFLRTGPRIMVNSIPKAGTHLLLQELEKFPALQNSRLHIQLDKVARDDSLPGSFEPDPRKLAKYFGQIRPGQYFSAHIHWYEVLDNLLKENEIKCMFVRRDPRAVLVSRYHYVMKLRRHYLHDFIANQVADDKDRWRLLIEGRESSPYIRPMKDMLQGFLPWTQADRALTVKFEDLVGERGGGSNEQKLHALNQVSAFCGLDFDKSESLASSPSRPSATLRKGRIDSWKEELPDIALELLYDHCRDEIEQMGYSTS